MREFRFPENYSSCAGLWKNAGGGIKFSLSDTRDEVQKKAEFAPDLFLVAEVKDIIIRTVIGGSDGRRGLVNHLALAPEERGKGLGKALMAEIETRLQQKGCKKMYLMVDPGHPELLDFYAQLGWSKMEILVAAKEFYS